MKDLVNKNEPISQVINGEKEVMNHFSSIFPEVIKSNETGTMTQEKFSLWQPGWNNINIELDLNRDRPTQF